MSRIRSAGAAPRLALDRIHIERTSVAGLLALHQRNAKPRPLTFLFFHQAQGGADQLAGYWRFNAASGITASDLSPNGHTATFGENEAKPVRLSAGPAVYAVRESEHPYVYRVSDDDSTGRLKQGGLVLVCQGETSGTSSGLFVLEVGHQPTLAWRTDNGRWKSAVRGRTVSAKSKITGHCLGIIWAHF